MIPATAIYFIAQASGAILSAFAAIMAWRRRSEPGAVPLALLMLAVTEWGVSGILKTLATPLNLKIFWAAAEILGAASASALYLLFVLEYVRQVKLLKHYIIILLWLLPIISFGLAASATSHTIFWTFPLAQGGPGPLLNTPGPFFWLYLAYYYTLRVSGTFILMRDALRYPASHRSQARVLIAGALAPWLSNLFSLVFAFQPGFTLISHELHPLAYALSGTILGWGIFRYRLFELVPLARDMIVENMRDGVIVVDSAGRIADMNSSAQRILGLDPKEALGGLAQQLLQDFPALVEMLAQTGLRSREILLPPPRSRHLEVHLTPIRDRQKHARGRMFTLRDVTEQKKYQQALVQSEANLSLLLEAAPFPMLITAQDGKLIYANPVAQEFFELQGLEPAKVDVTAYYAQPEERQAILRQMENGQRVDGMEVKLRTRSGQERWTVLSARKVLFNGQIVLLSALFDISARKQSEEALRRSRAQLQVIFDYAGVGIRVLDRDGLYTFSNTHWAEMLGLLPENLLGRKETDFLHPNEIPYNRQMFAALLAGETHHYSLENRYQRTDGSLFWGALTVTPTYNEPGEIDSVVGFILDVTQQKQAEISLRETERRFREILENIHMLAVMLDDKGNITFCNDHTLAITGWYREELLGRNWFETFIPAEAGTRQGFGRAIQQGNIVSRHENTILTRWGEPRLVSWSNILLRDADNRVTGMASLGEDITELRQAMAAETAQRTFAEALSDTTAAIVSSLDFDETLARILANLDKVVPHDAANICLIKNGRLLFLRARGYENFGVSTADVLAHSPLYKKIPNMRRMAETRQPLVVSDIHAVPNWVELPTTAWIQSYVGAPIVIQDKVVGFLNVNSATPSFFTQQHADRLKAISLQAAIAIENSQLFAKSLHELEERRKAEARLRRANKKLETQLTEIKALQTQLREQAIRDPLTGLYNRRYLEETLIREIARAKRDQTPISVVMIDIDHFKKVNDTYGHGGGDQMLKALSQMLLAETRRSDVPCRYGGEEFAVIMPGGPLSIACERAEKWRRAFDALKIRYKEFELHATLSLGVAAFPPHGETGDLLLACADKALYASKQAGRNRVTLATVEAS